MSFVCPPTHSGDETSLTFVAKGELRAHPERSLQYESGNRSLAISALRPSPVFLVLGGSIHIVTADSRELITSTFGNRSREPVAHPVVDLPRTI